MTLAPCIDAAAGTVAVLAPSPLDDVPRPHDRRLAVRVTKDALRQIRGGHPWLFDQSITSAQADGVAGDLAVVFDDKRRFAAIGLYDPDSPIRVRILHAGGPAPIDDDFWRARLTAALDRRHELFEDPGTTGFRLVHGENDGFPGLVADRYDTTVVVKVYSAAWLPHVRRVLDVLVDVVADHGVDIDRVVLRLGRLAAAGRPFGLGDATVVSGEAPTTDVEFLERGLVFGADVLHGQKTGHFLDQRDNRVLVGGLSEGRRVLDLFCCTGGFGVHAAAGAARLVHSVDLSAPAVATAAANLDRNRTRTSATRHLGTVGDAFEVLTAMGATGEQYDLVIVDPPSFASSSAQTAGALRAYGRLTRLALDVLAGGGLLVQSSCSSRVSADEFHSAIHEAAGEAGVQLAEWARTTHAVDHPIGFPEGAYLKTLIAQRR